MRERGGGLQGETPWDMLDIFINTTEKKKIFSSTFSEVEWGLKDIPGILKMPDDF